MLVKCFLSFGSYGKLVTMKNGRRLLAKVRLRIRSSNLENGNNFFKTTYAFLVKSKILTIIFGRVKHWKIRKILFRKYFTPEQMKHN
jgi:hypothetical protein